MAALFAYLTNPLVKRLEKWRVPHILAVLLIFAALFGVIAMFVLMLFPLIQKQIVALIEVLPDLINWIEKTVAPWVKEFVSIDTAKTTLSESLTKTGWVLSTVVSSGYTLTNWIINLVLIPVVTFYYLRDWDKILLQLKNIIPNKYRPTVVKLANQCDEVLGAFFRGQLLVMLGLCLIYSIGLMTIGLKLGLIIGLIGGILSIVPYLGSAFVLIGASIAALVQFGEMNALIGVLIVFLIGQTIEGYILTPYLVGERIGLHPVAVIFAIMAGGTLFGFFGILLALPAAAVIMVLLRHLNHRYNVVKV